MKDTQNDQPVGRFGLLPLISGLFLVVVVPLVGVPLLIIAGLAFVAHCGQRGVAKQQAEQRARERWQRDMILAAKSLP